MGPSIDILKKEKSTGQKEYITNEIFNLMDNNEQQYKEIQRILPKKIRKAKGDYNNQKCEEIEELVAKHDSFNIHSPGSLNIIVKEIERNIEEINCKTF